MRTILILVAAVILTGAGLPAKAQVSDADRAAFRQIITSQIEAFGANDGERAYSFATPELQRKFGSPPNFMQSVRNGYAPLYQPRSYYFSAATLGVGGKPTQRLFVIGPHGQPWLALYTFERHPHDGWRISGVALRPFGDDGSGVQFIAVLEPKDSDTAFVVLHDPRTGRLDVSQIAGDRPADTDFELWLIEGEDAPVSLGLVGGAGKNATAVPAGPTAGLPEGATLAVSLEPTGGSTTGAPTGPVIAAGAVTA